MHFVVPHSTSKFAWVFFDVQSSPVTALMEFRKVGDRVKSSLQIEVTGDQFFDDDLTAFA